MASNDVVGQIWRILQPATLFATLDARAGGSTPAENYTVYDFDDTTAEYLDYLCYLGPNYAGGGLTITLPWTATSATSNAVVWRAAIRRLNTSEDVDASHSYDFNSASASSAPATNGQPVYPTVAFTSGADMDSLVAGEMFILRVGRLPTDAGDTMTGDAELWLPVIRET